VLVPNMPSTPTPSPSPNPIPTLKALSTIINMPPTGAATFATALKASPMVLSALLSPTFKGTVLVPSDAVSLCARRVLLAVRQALAAPAEPHARLLGCPCCLCLGSWGHWGVGEHGHAHRPARRVVAGLQQ
jgi:hypothetical protein